MKNNIENKLITRGKMSLILLISLFTLWGCGSIQRSNMNYPFDTAKDFARKSSNNKKEKALVYMRSDLYKTTLIIDPREIRGISIKGLFHYPERFLDDPEKYYKGEMKGWGKTFLIMEYKRKKQENEK